MNINFDEFAQNCEKKCTKIQNKYSLPEKWEKINERGAIFEISFSGRKRRKKQPAHRGAAGIEWGENCSGRGRRI